MRIATLIAAACALTLSTGAQAQDRKAAPQPEQIAHYPGGKIAPERAYLLYRAPLSLADLMLLRMPPEAKSPGGGTVDYPAVDPDMVVDIAKTRLAFLRDRNLFLIEIQPGTYTLYGDIGTGEFGFEGHCLCMGTVSFEVRAGQVTNLGELIPPAAGTTGFAIVPASAPLPMLPPFTDSVAAPATYHAGGKLPNLLGVEIDRMAPIPGVLGYERDNVIDLASVPAPAQ